MSGPHRQLWRQTWYISRAVRSISTWEEEEIQCGECAVYLWSLLFRSGADMFRINDPSDDTVSIDGCDRVIPGRVTAHEDVMWL